LKTYSFAAYYIKDKKVVAAAGMQRGVSLIMINQAMRLNLHTTLDDFVGNKLDEKKIAQRISDARPKCKCQRASSATN
jgi:hypothetical protein